MSIKGVFQELYVGKAEANLITGFGSRKNIPYEELKQINYAFSKFWKIICIIIAVKY